MQNKTHTVNNFIRHHAKSHTCHAIAKAFFSVEHRKTGKTHYYYSPVGDATILECVKEVDPHPHSSYTLKKFKVLSFVNIEDLLAQDVVFASDSMCNNVALINKDGVRCTDNIFGQVVYTYNATFQYPVFHASIPFNMTFQLLYKVTFDINSCTNMSITN